MDRILELIGELRVRRALDPHPTPGKYSFGQLLEAAQVARGAQVEIYKVLASHQGPPAQLWEKVRKIPGLDDRATAQVRFVMEAGQISGNYLPLVQQLRQRAATAGFAELKSFTRWRSASIPLILNRTSAPSFSIVTLLT